MKKTHVLLLMFMLCFFLGGQSHASWFIDTDRFQTSVHGENSCLDCHEAVLEEALHPNPENVDKPLSEGFDPETCAMCHPDILDSLEDGRHAGRMVENPDKYAECTNCHDPHYEKRTAGTPVPAAFPELSEEDAACMACHGKLDPDDPKRAERIIALCFHCHGKSGTAAQALTKESVPLIDPRAYATVPHAALDCTECHRRAAAFPHSRQELEDCLGCHRRHHEKVAHAAHLDVACGACHLQGVEPVRNSETAAVEWTIARSGEAASRVHEMAGADTTEACRRCHFDGNEVGAAAMVLPAKSILCMPCHAATFSIGDATTILSMLVFSVGIVAMFSYFLTGTVGNFSYADGLQKLSWLVRAGFRSVFSNRFKPIAASLFFDVFLQRRLFRQSPKRWAVHGLIFFPFVIRFLWGFIALLGSLWFPAWSPVWAMLDKNNPVTALVFDLTGLMIILGVVLILIRGRVIQPQRPQGLPRQDYLALGLIAGIVLVGFLLEGMRIAMTGWPQGSVFGVVGYVVSHLFSTGPGLNQAYGYVWYIHAILTGGFIAYIPFSRLSHIILAPVTLAMGGAGQDTHK